jgi:hypothetical protein
MTPRPSEGRACPGCFCHFAAPPGSHRPGCFSNPSEPARQDCGPGALAPVTSHRGPQEVRSGHDFVQRLRPLGCLGGTALRTFAKGMPCQGVAPPGSHRPGRFSNPSEPARQAGKPASGRGPGRGFPKEYLLPIGRPWNRGGLREAGRGLDVRRGEIVRRDGGLSKNPDMRQGVSMPPRGAITVRPRGPTIRGSEIEPGKHPVEKGIQCHRQHQRAKKGIPFEQIHHINRFTVVKRVDVQIPEMC